MFECLDALVHLQVEMHITVCANVVLNVVLTLGRILVVMLFLTLGGMLQ